MQSRGSTEWGFRRWVYISVVLVLAIDVIGHYAFGWKPFRAGIESLVLIVGLIAILVHKIYRPRDCSNCGSRMIKLPEGAIIPREALCPNCGRREHLLDESVWSQPDRGRAKDWAGKTINAMAEVAYNLPHMWDHAFGPDRQKVLDRERIKGWYRRM